MERTDSQNTDYPHIVVPAMRWDQRARASTYMCCVGRWAVTQSVEATCTEISRWTAHWYSAYW